MSPVQFGLFLTRVAFDGRLIWPVNIVLAIRSICAASSESRNSSFLVNPPPFTSAVMSTRQVSSTWIIGISGCALPRSMARSPQRISRRLPGLTATLIAGSKASELPNLRCLGVAQMADRPRKPSKALDRGSARIVVCGAQRLDPVLKTKMNQP